MVQEQCFSSLESLPHSLTHLINRTVIDAPIQLLAALFTANGEYITAVFSGSPELGDAIKYAKTIDQDGWYATRLVAAAPSRTTGLTILPVCV